MILSIFTLFQFDDSHNDEGDAIVTLPAIEILTVIGTKYSGKDGGPPYNNCSSGYAWTQLKGIETDKDIVQGATISNRSINTPNTIMLINMIWWTV